MNNFYKKYLNDFTVLLLLIIHTFLLIKLKFSAWPEMLTYPWLMLKQYRLYTDIILPYAPLLPNVLKNFYSFFGVTISSLKLFTNIVIIISDLFIYVIAKKQFGKKLGIFSLGIFITSQIFFEGNGLWFELASLPLLLLAFLLLDKGKIAFAGFCMGLLILIKQNNVLFVIPVVFYLINNKRSILRFGIFTILPFLLVFVFYLTRPNFNDFFYWVLYHPVFVHGKSPGFLLLPTAKELLFICVWFFPIIFIWKKNIALFISFIISMFFAFPRFGLFHLQYSCAFFSLFIPYIFKIKNKFRYLVLIIYIPLISVLFLEFLVKEFEKPVRFFTSDVIETRLKLSNIIPKNKPVFFLNASSEYFVGSDLLPEKPWADNFPWYLEVPGMQEKIIKSLDDFDVRWIVFKPYGNEGEYVPGSYKPELIAKYVNENYIFDKQISSDIILLKRKE